jgi:hypothetical protein
VRSFCSSAHSRRSIEYGPGTPPSPLLCLEIHGNDQGGSGTPLTRRWAPESAESVWMNRPAPEEAAHHLQPTTVWFGLPGLACADQLLTQAVSNYRSDGGTAQKNGHGDHPHGFISRNNQNTDDATDEAAEKGASPRGCIPR